MKMPDKDCYRYNYRDIDVGYWVLPKDKTAPKLLSKSVWIFRKTGKHIDLNKLFD